MKHNICLDHIILLLSEASAEGHACESQFPISIVVPEIFRVHSLSGTPCILLYLTTNDVWYSPLPLVHVQKYYKDRKQKWSALPPIHNLSSRSKAFFYVINVSVQDPKMNHSGIPCHC